jgi:hypothetical protein
MSFFTGTVNVARYYMKPPRRVSRDEIVLQLQRQLISPIGLDEAREMSSGWCQYYTAEPELDDEFLGLDGTRYYLFGMRMDRKSIPGSTYRIQLKAALEGMRPSSDDPATKPRIPRKIKDAVRDRIKMELLKQSCPNVQVWGVLWNPETGALLTDAVAQNAKAALERLMVDTFALPFIPVNTGILGIDLNTWNTEGTAYALERRLDLTPVAFGEVRNG